MKTLCADLGGTRLKLAAVENGVVLENEVTPIDTNAGMEHVLENLTVRCRAMMSRHAGEWKGLGVAFPGILDEAARHVIYCSGKYAGADKIDLPKWASESLGLEMKLINDARAAIIGEINYGSATGETDAVMLILGTGIGTAAVCQGKVYRGKHGMAGLLGGHFSIDFDNGRKCICGGTGCLEAYAGTWALKELAEDKSYDFQRLERDYLAGDEKAKMLFGIQAKALGAGAVSLIHAFDAETVIFSGGGSRFAALLEAAEAYVYEHVWTPWGKVKFIVAQHPEDSVVLGLHSLFVHHVC